MRPAALFPRIKLHRPGLDLLTILCVVLIAVQAVVAALGGPYVIREGEQTLREFFGALALSRSGLAEGKVWQVATHAFLHGGWIHLMLNWLVIFMIGGRIVHILGARGFAVIFFGGVLGGSVLHLLLQPDAPLGIDGELVNAPLVGASAGAMSLLLALTGLSPDSRMWPFPVSGKNLGRGLLLSSLLLFLITPGLRIPGLSALGSSLLDFERSIMKFCGAEDGYVSIFQIGHIYHFGGGLVGWFYVKRLLRQPLSLEDLKKKRAKREGVAA